MHYLLVMHMLKCRSYLNNVFPYFNLLEGKLFLDMRFYKFFEVSFRSPFANDNQLIVISKAIDILDDIRMLERFHQLNFLQTFLSLFGIHHIKYLKLRMFYFDLFHSYRNTLRILAIIDSWELSLSYGF